MPLEQNRFEEANANSFEEPTINFSNLNLSSNGQSSAKVDGLVKVFVFYHHATHYQD